MKISDNKLTNAQQAGIEAAVKRRTLPCGCVGECDSRAHDTHPDGICKPAGPGKDDQMEMLARRIDKARRSIGNGGDGTFEALEAAFELAELILGEE